MLPRLKDMDDSTKPEIASRAQTLTHHIRHYLRDMRKYPHSDTWAVCLYYIGIAENWIAAFHESEEITFDALVRRAQLLLPRLEAIKNSGNGARIHKAITHFEQLSMWLRKGLGQNELDLLAFLNDVKQAEAWVYELGQTAFVQGKGRG